MPLVGVLAVLVIIALAVWGYFALRGGDADVRGLVTVDGAPVPSAIIVFIKEDPKSETTITAQADAQGNYRLIGNTGAGIPPGTYKVAVTQMTLKDGKIPPGSEIDRARAMGLLSNAMPKEYEDRQTTPLKFDIRPGANTIKLELKRPLRMQ